MFRLLFRSLIHKLSLCFAFFVSTSRLEKLGTLHVRAGIYGRKIVFLRDNLLIMKQMFSYFFIRKRVHKHQLEAFV